MSEKRESDNTQNNNGTLGSEGGVKHESKGSFKEFTESLKTPQANEQGIRENEEDHSSQSKRANREFETTGSYAENEVDPNKPGYSDSNGNEVRYPKIGPNHVDNLGGTSAEELDDNN